MCRRSVSIELDLSALERVVVVVAASGVVTGKDLGLAAEQLTGGASDYGRIIDVSTAISDLSREQAEGIVALMRARAETAPLGAVAFVVHPDQLGVLQTVAGLTDGDGRV